MSTKLKTIAGIGLISTLMILSAGATRADDGKSDGKKEVKVSYDHCVVQNTITSGHLHMMKPDGSYDPKPSVLPVVMHSNSPKCADHGKDQCVMSLLCVETKTDATTGKVIETVPNKSQTAICEISGGNFQAACPSPDTCLKLSNKNYSSYGALASDEYISEASHPKLHNQNSDSPAAAEKAQPK